ncbi:MAG: 5-oxoprolinase (ATP-hydrolyzing), partial [Verrucomicrobiales bacterium]
MTWKISIDTGGTFTDAYAIAPDGMTLRTKVLSNSTLRLPVISSSDRVVTIPLDKPDNFFRGFTLNGQVVTGSVGGTLEVTHSNPDLAELSTGEEAPILAVRLLTNTSPGSRFPPLELRVGTTRGTNALLENRGAPTALFTSPGFRDLLTIGDQRRPDL